jgi:hypothetical protein
VRRFFFLLLALISSAGVWLCEARPDAQPPINKEQRTANFCLLFTNAFTAWDTDHDGKLTYLELSAAIENPKIHNSQSAVAVAFHDKMIADNGDNGAYDVTNVLALTDAVKLAKNSQVQKKLLGRAWNTGAFEHSLFSLNDPNLLTIRQDGLGDSCLVSLIGTFIYHNPQALWVMIAPQSDGSYKLQFDSGKMIAVAPITETELMLAGNQGRRHGIWLSVLEKAYRQFSLETNVEPVLNVIESETTNIDLTSRNGRCVLAINLLTGHEAAEAPMGRWMREDPTNGLERVHELLTELAQDQQLMCVHTSQNLSIPLPAGIPHNHALGILTYDSQTRTVTLFNPRSNQLKPVDPPGLINGYATEYGVFKMPLADFVKIFDTFTYETNTFIDLVEETAVHSCEMIASR